MPILPLMMVLADPDTLLAAHRRATRAEVPCEAPKDDTEVLVCGRRAADRYRPPFETRIADDAVFAERVQLMHDPMPKCGITGPFLNSCGHVGVGVSTNGSGVRLTTRKLAD